MNTSLKQIKLVKAQQITRENLIVFNKIDKEIFKTKRFFTISDKIGSIRGKHAHINCQQFLICMHGKIKVICKDVKNTKTFILSNPTKGLLIPKGIWSTQYYLAKINILNVFCDKDFRETDYIRDYNKYLKFYKNK